MGSVCWLISSAAVCFLASLTSGELRAQVGAPGATYFRMRAGADQWSQRGDGWGFAGSRGGYGLPPYSPYPYAVAGPTIAGTWYARPYPYHFDYYRQRWGGGQPDPTGAVLGDMPVEPPAPCPCESDPAPAGP